jgi:hypothetical protein
MELDDLKAAWAAHGAALERSLAIDQRILRELLLRKVRFALAPWVCFRALEVVLGLAVLGAVVPVLAAHLAEPRYVVVAGAVVVFAAWMTALCAYLLVNTLQLDYSGPVTALQRDVERLKLVEYRAFKWALLGGVLLWLPVPALLLEALTGFEALARIEPGFLAANVAFGLVFLALGQALSRRHVERSDLGPRARRIVDALSGRGLRAATGHLTELAHFQGEEPSAK